MTSREIQECFDIQNHFGIYRIQNERLSNQRNDINTIKCFDKFAFYDCKCVLANIQTYIYIYEEYARDLTLISGVYLAVALTDLQ